MPDESHAKPNRHSEGGNHSMPDESHARLEEDSSQTQNIVVCSE